MTNLKRKTILALALMLLLAAAGTLLLVRQGVRLVEEREEIRSVRKLEAADKLYRLIVERVSSVYASLQDNGRKDAALMALALRRHLDDGAYTGKLCFEDGLVFHVENGEPVFPDTVPEDFGGFDGEVLAWALDDPHHNGGMIRKADGLSWEELDELRDADTFAYMSHFHLVFIDEIGDGWYYAALGEAADFYRSLETFTYAEELIAAAEEAFGGALLIVNTADDGMPLEIRSARFAGVDYAEELGLAAGDVQSRKKELSLNGQPWQCAYRDADTAENVVLIFASPTASDRAELTQDLLPVTLVMVVFFTTMCIYVISAQAFVRDRILGEDLASKYRPVNLRLRCVALGAVGALLVFVAASLLQAVSVLRAETLAGSETVQALFENLQTLEGEKAAASRARQEDWYVDYAERIADRIAEDPSLAEEASLQTLCDVLQVDYLMTFDDAGRESACSRGYRDFTLSTGTGDCWDDFGRLLMGVPAIVRDTETDARTGLMRQLIGVRLPLEGSERYGALVMALYPETIGAQGGSYGSLEQLKSMTVEGTTILFADAESGTILNASVSSLVGNAIEEYGLSADTLRDGYMDFDLIGGVRSYVVTAKSGDTVIYSVTDTAVLFRNCLSYGLMAALVFFAIFLILYGVLMFGYTEHKLEVYSRIGMPLEEDAARAYFGRANAGTAPDRAGRRWLDLSSWRALNPEEKAAAFFRTFSCLVILLYLLLRAGETGGRFSLMSFILLGDWMRGFNLFSLCATVLLIVGIYVFLTLCRGVMRLLCSALDSRGVTICRLIFNLLQYVTIFLLLYQAFSYAGLPTGTVLASVGVATLAITFGAQSLVADVLAGVFNVLEGGYRVGDYILLDGFEGTVRSIGVRTTKIESPTRSIEIIENSKIGKVVNMTPLDYIIQTKLVVPCSESLERIEAIFREEFPRIAAGMPQILDGPKYIGVIEVSSSKVVPHEPSMTLRIDTKASSDDFLTVKTYVNREVILLCQRENIRFL